MPGELLGRTAIDFQDDTFSAEQVTASKWVTKLLVDQRNSKFPVFPGKKACGGNRVMPIERRNTDNCGAA